jgi:hypothetical protein
MHLEIRLGNSIRQHFANLLGRCYELSKNKITCSIIFDLSNTT